MIALLPLNSRSADLDLLRPVGFQPLQLDFQDAVVEARLDLVGIDPERQLDRTREGAVGALATLPIGVLLLGFGRLAPSRVSTSSCRLIVTSFRVTPGSSLVTTTLLSPSQMLIGGKSRAAGAYPENSRFISLCIRRSSTNGSKPNRGNSESAMVSPSLHVDTSVAADPDQLGTQGGAGAHDRADGNCRRHSPVPRGGGGVGNDHILATKRYDRGRPIHGPTVIPCRDPTSGIRHPFDLVTPRQCSSGPSAKDTREARERIDSSNENSAITPIRRPLNGAVRELDTGSPGGVR